MMEFQEEFYQYCEKNSFEHVELGSDLFIPKRENKVVITSGFFNPVHSGHLNLMREAKKLGDKLIVIVNNDEQVRLKGSCKFQSQEERAEIIGDLRYVDEVFIAIDKDITIADSIRHLKANVFAKGGDRRDNSSMPASELAACEEVGTSIVYGVGGFDKKNSSSSIIKKMIEYLYESGKLMKFIGKMNKAYQSGKSERESFCELLEKFHF